MAPGETAPLTLDGLFAHLNNPPRECRPLGFWFWNDDIDDDLILAQLSDFAAAGFGGVVIHPRTGLAPSIGYLTERYFELVRTAVDECARLGLQVVLYDEASYPSGSANGAVAAENPRFAARALARTQRDVHGPWRGYWRPTLGRSLDSHLVCAVLAQVVDGVVDAGTLHLLTLDGQGLARIDVGPGEWRLMACFDRPSRGTIRGAFGHQDDDSAQAPPAGNVLDPEAVACFIRLTHDAYAAALGGHLGTTVTAVFTDEPSPLGRNAAPGLLAYTPGMEAELATRAGLTGEQALAQLPLLWEGSDTAKTLMSAYDACIHDRLRHVLFGQLAAWCDRHGVALTGHPEHSNDVDCLEPFHWPGQDVVWRWVLPDGSATSGAHSASALTASSAARLRGRRHNVTEVFGAYGWQLSLDEMKWLLDWHFARGTNLIVVHALFASVTGNRAFESEPDLGVHHPAFEALGDLVRYAARISWLLTDGQRPPAVAVVGEGHALPWQAATTLLQHQVETVYVSASALASARLDGETLHVGSLEVRQVVVDHSNGPVPLASDAVRQLDALLAAGGQVLHVDDDCSPALAELAMRQRSDIPGRPDPGLRVVRTRKGGLTFHLLVNEGETEISGEVDVDVAGSAYWWDPLRGTHVRAARSAEHRSAHPYRLGRRESIVLVSGLPPEAHVPEASPLGEWRDVTVGDWSVTDALGHEAQVPTLGDWVQVRDWETFAGTLTYTTEVVLAHPAVEVAVDLGGVGESCSLRVNGLPAGIALWSPYAVTTPGMLWREGPNTLEVAVTNSAANRFEGAMRESGLLGPVRLRARSI